MKNNTYIKFEAICRKAKGYIRTKELLEQGFSNRQIAVLEKEDYLEKVCYGYYWLKGRGDEKPKDYKCIEVCLSDARAVVCMESALYYQKEIDLEPEYLTVATERTDRSSLKMNYPVRRHYFSKNNFGIGIEKKKTEFGSYNIYNVERSICDVIRLKDQITTEISSIDQIVVEITRIDKREQYNRLMQYAKLLKINELH